jgi:predicted aldo/keto reductase-like oxidoreductase
MNERVFGKTGVRVKVLGFGAARLPESKRRRFNMELAVPVLRRAIDLGVNYIDSAQAYGAGSSEIAVGLAIKGYDRAGLTLTTKIPVNNALSARAATWRKRLEISLRRMDTPYIDFVFMHGLTWDGFAEHASKPGHALDEMRKAQAEGLIRQVCFSSHDSPQAILRLIDTGEFAGMLVQYNCLDRRNEAVIAHASAHGMGVAIMGPLVAGFLVAPGNTTPWADAPAASRSALALGYVWRNPHVTVALSGMSSVAQVDENIAAAEQFSALSEAERVAWERFYVSQEQRADAWCTYCGACLPCPKRVDIVENLRYMNWQRAWGVQAPARAAYAKLNGRRHWEPWGMFNGRKASACNGCGECEARCPQHVPIVEQLRATAETLGGVALFQGR